MKRLKRSRKKEPAPKPRPSADDTKKVNEEPFVLIGQNDTNNIHGSEEPTLNSSDPDKLPNLLVYSSKKQTKVSPGSIRRSQRIHKQLQNPIPSSSFDAEILIQDLTEMETDKEDLGEPTLKNPKPSTEKDGMEELEAIAGADMNTKEKVDYLMKTVQGLQKVINEMRCHKKEEGLSGVRNYRSLYIAARKKLELLTEEKHDMTLELEKSRSQIDIYEKMMKSMLKSFEKKEGIANMSSQMSGVIWGSQNGLKKTKDS